MACRASLLIVALFASFSTPAFSGDEENEIWTNCNNNPSSKECRSRAEMVLIFDWVPGVCEEIYGRPNRFFEHFQYQPVTDDWPEYEFIDVTPRVNYSCSEVVAFGEFIVNGLRIESLKNNQEPVNCNATEADFTKLSNSTKEDLQKVWKTVYHVSENVLWEQEWKEHGSCFGKIDKMEIQTIEKYFSWVIEKFNKLPVQLWFLNQGILPTDRTKYSLDKLRHVIAKQISGVRVSFNCRRTESKGTFLKSIVFCYSMTDDPKLVDCKRKDQGCEETAVKYIYLPHPPKTTEEKQPIKTRSFDHPPNPQKIRPSGF